MKIPHKTKHIIPSIRPAMWMRMIEVADRLGVSRPTAIKWVQDGKVPGGERLYRDDHGHEHWRVHRETFDAWFAATPFLDPRPDNPIVYFIQRQDVPDDPVKIGASRTANIDRRLATIQVYSPHRLVVLATMPGDFATEKELHKRFKEHRLHSEWFRMNPELRALIDDAKCKTG